jgi:diazepam-binding inhibitor (GABA receptor modulating acyl-CoA-binding protein)
MTLETDFKKAAAQARGLPSQPDEVLLELYGLYKQATVGDVAGDEPGMFDFVGRAKHRAWEALRGKSHAEAMQAYIDRVAELAGG